MSGGRVSQPYGNAAAMSDMTCMFVDTDEGERVICSETEILETPEERIAREVREGRDPDFHGERSDMTCFTTGRPGHERMICSEAEVPESDDDRRTREMMEASARARRADPLSLEADHPMTSGSPPPPSGRVRHERHEAGTRVLDGGVETDDTSIHPWFAGWEEYDDDAGRVGVGTGDGHAGIWETPDGDIRIGASGRVEVFGAEADAPDGSGMDIQGAGVTGDCWFGSEGLSVGFGGTAVGVAGEGGASDEDRADDDHVRVGGSAGLSAGFRAHWGDSDGDGHPEYGIGADIGPVSIDVTSEDILGMPGRAWDWLTR